MSENIIWKVLGPIITKEGGDACRHEDKYQQGIPDISYGIRKVNGWIESKFISKWPRTGVVKLRKYTIKQRNWMTRRQKAGGHCYIILLVGEDIKNRQFIIFSGDWAKKLGHMTMGEMYKNCLWKGNDRDLHRCMLGILS